MVGKIYYHSHSKMSEVEVIDALADDASAMVYKFL